MRRYAELTQTKRRIEAQLKAAQDQITEMEQPLLEDMALQGMSTTSFDDLGVTVFKQRSLGIGRVDGVSSYELADILAANGMADCIGYNHMKLQARVRECEANEEKLPEAVAAALDIKTLYNLRVRAK